MTRKRAIVLLGAAFAGASGLLGAGAATSPASVTEGMSRPGRVVLLQGTAVGQVRDVSAFTGAPGASQALCFDIPIIDPLTGRVIGTASDCLMNVQPVGNEGGMSLTAVTFFNLPGGTIVAQGNTSVQPTTIGSPSVTHITGAIPDAGQNSIIAGTGAFRRATGPVRLSGAVNLSRLGSHGEITFDCVFIIDLD